MFQEVFSPDEVNVYQLPTDTVSNYQRNFAGKTEKKENGLGTIIASNQFPNSA